MGLVWLGIAKVSQLVKKYCFSYRAILVSLLENC